MAMLLIIPVALRWILIGGALVVLWYLLAPLFTPSSIKARPHRKAWEKDAEVIDGEGRVIK